MAVVQISRIQQRRGKKNAGTGLPQLASGELAWCVDTQELFIGNGSVAEGSPYVGNTRLLSEHDDLVSLVGKYQFAKLDPAIQTGANANYPIIQNLQEILDQRITLTNFDVRGDGESDDTQALQRAIDQLFLNAATQGLPKYRVKLIVGPGNYRLTDTLYIPSYATIEGVGKDKSIFMFENDGPMVQFTDDTSTTSQRSFLGENTIYNNQARNISISGISFISDSATNIGWQLDAVRDSKFTDIVISGAWTNTPASSDSLGIQMNALSADIVTCQRNVFTNVEITGFSYAVWSDTDISSNKFIDCYFHHLYKGFSLGFNSNLYDPGQEYGPKNITIESSLFYKVHQHGVIVYHGNGNTVSNSTFIDVGNGNLGNLFSTFAHIDFQEVGNSAVSNKHDREDELETDTDAGFLSTPYVPTVNAYGLHETKSIKEVDVSYFPTFKLLFRLPVTIKKQAIVKGFSIIGYEITYNYRSTNQTQSRFGKITVHVDVTNENVQLVDDYEYTGSSTYETNLDFKAVLLNSDLSAGFDTLGIYYRNSTVNDTALLCYSYRTLSSNQSV